MNSVDTSTLTILGRAVNQPVRNLEVFTKPEGVLIVEFTTSEFTSLCPKTGQPDFYRLRIRYRPLDYCIESKSLKLYLWTFRETGQFIEELSCIILDDIIRACSPSWAIVDIEMVPRGGIAIRSISGKRREESLTEYVIMKESEVYEKLI